MVKKEYILLGDDKKLTHVLEDLKYNNLNFKFRTGFRNNGNFILRLYFNISPDMVQEVEDLIMEIAKKSGVKVE